MRKVTIHFLLFLFSLNALFAAHEISIRSEPIFPETEGDWLQLTIPLKRVGNLFLLEAKVDSIEGNFILDTGAPNLVLNQTYFRNAKISDGTTASGIGSSNNNIKRLTTDSLTIGDLVFKNITADVIPLGHLENMRGIKVIGLIGAGLFYNLEIEIDANNSVLIIYKIDKQGNRIVINENTPILIPDILLPLQLFNNVLLIDGKINGKKLKFVFDSGAEVNVLDYNVHDKVLEFFSLTTRKIISGSTNTKIEVLNGEIRELEIGTILFKNIPFVVSDLSNLQLAYGLNIDGILGYEIIAKGKIVINLKRKLFIMYFYKEDDQ
ncbi:MAG: aspartyl protease family protein [Chitinophagales bacterium]|nr:aspartyl protease family protein [Bacteroidota bacterium]MBP7400440.1 aspartyl protease family protein [Chitinophagales bacterium]MBK8682475.1 aspartyl protease family protein [Bacteroidota bacterium]MBP8753452.1 aspartyl protease family protein [Chitinophagales bacterium]MBP9188475.1 aspartyl protease family protein [Chitinophagales bacterium]